MTLAMCRPPARPLASFAARLRTDTHGVALTEFAFCLPIFVVMCLGGTEMANYITTKMRLSQIALQVADNAARMGNGSRLAAKTISETDINDLFAGAQLESSGLNLRANGRVILSSLENNASTSGPADAYRIGWQRCYGTKTAQTSSYGTAGNTVAYMGPASRQTKVLPDNATMFVELYYRYTPIIRLEWVPNLDIREIASMAVRDRRNLAAPPSNTEAAAIATC